MNTSDAEYLYDNEVDENMTGARTPIIVPSFDHFFHLSDLHLKHCKKRNLPFSPTIEQLITHIFFPGFFIQFEEHLMKMTSPRAAQI